MEAMKIGVPHIVIDNTHIEPFEAKPYVERALQYGYDVYIQEVNTPWRFNADELVRLNTHGVSKDIIEKMISLWSEDYSIPTILNSKAPWEPDESQ